MAYYNLIVKCDPGGCRINEEFRATTLVDVKKKLLSMFKGMTSYLFGWYTCKIKLEEYDEDGDLRDVHDLLPIITLTIDDVCTCKYVGKKIIYYSNSGNKFDVNYNEFADENFMMLRSIVSNELFQVFRFKAFQDDTFTKLIISDIEKNDAKKEVMVNTFDTVRVTDELETVNSPNLHKLYKNKSKKKGFEIVDKHHVFISVDWSSINVADLVGKLCDDPDILGTHDFE